MSDFSTKMALGNLETTLLTLMATTTAITAPTPFIFGEHPPHLSFVNIPPIYLL